MIEKFKNLGVIKVDSYPGQGVAIRFLQEWTELDVFSQNEQANQTEMKDRSISTLSYKDRKKEDLSIFQKNGQKTLNDEGQLRKLTNADILDFWPHLYSLDFRRAEIAKILKHAKIQDADINDLEIFESLQRIDFEIEHEINFDKDGNKYRAGYVVKGLIHGLWRKPDGYLSPEEKRLKELKI